MNLKGNLRNIGILFVTALAVIRSEYFVSKIFDNVNDIYGGWQNSVGDTFIGTSSQIFKIDVDNNVTTVAEAGNTNINSGPAIGAVRFQVRSLQSDSIGDIYFADFSSCGIRKLDLNTSIISMFAGGGFCDYADGVGTNARFGNDIRRIYIYDSLMYVPDYNNHRIRTVTIPGQVVTTIAGNGLEEDLGAEDELPATSAYISYPSAIYVDSIGQIFVASEVTAHPGTFDPFLGTIKKIDTNGIVSTYFGPAPRTTRPVDGPRTDGTLDNAKSLWGDTLGNLFFSETNRYIRYEPTATPTEGPPSYGGYGGYGGPSYDYGAIEFISLVRVIENDFVSTIIGTGNVLPDNLPDNTPGLEVNLDFYSTVTEYEQLWGDSSGFIYFTRAGSVFKATSEIATPSLAPSDIPTLSPTPTDFSKAPSAIPTLVTSSPSWVAHSGAPTKDGPLSFAKNQFLEKFSAGFTRTYANGTSNKNDWDAFVAKFKADSIIRDWKFHLGGEGHDIAYSVTTDDEGFAYVCGKTSQSLPGFTNAGGTDVFVSKLNRDGVEMWHYQYGTLGDDAAFKVRVNSDNNSISIRGTMNGVEFVATLSSDGELL